MKLCIHRQTQTWFVLKAKTKLETMDKNAFNKTVIKLEILHQADVIKKQTDKKNEQAIFNSSNLLSIL